MEGVRQKCRPKHQVLVLKCYPQYQKGIAQVKPNPSELSYLLYYVSTRRSKLTKVGAFLEKRAARDVWRRKIGNVQVTLQILSALIEKVPRDLPIYVRSVLTVLETVIRSNEVSLVEDSIPTFETLCQHQDMAALSAEQEFASQYREVVRTYASFADSQRLPQPKTVQTPQMSIRWKNVGLQAIQGVVSSEAGLAADGGDSLKVILPVILENLYNGDDDLLTTLEHHLHEAERPDPIPTHRRRISTATVETVDTVEGDPALAARSTADADRKAEMDMRLLALRCLERIVVTGSSRGQIRVTTKVVLDFILRRGQASKQSLSLDAKDSWDTALIELVAKWCPVQVRFIILAAAMEFLLDTKPSDKPLDAGFTVVFMIDWLLKSPVSMIGLSVIDILLGLLRYVSSLPALEADAAKELEQRDRQALSARKSELHALLQRCIGDLATHIYYGEQVSDMIRAILTRINPSSGDESATASVPIQTDSVGLSPTPVVGGETDHMALQGDAKSTALKSIKSVLLVASSKRPESAVVETRQPVGIHTWQGTQWLLRDPEREVRFAYADAFLAWLVLETNHNDLSVKDRAGRLSSPSPRRDLPDIAEQPGKRSGPSGNHREKALQAAQSNFLRLFHLTVYDIALECATDEAEIMLLHLLLTSLVDRLGVNAARFGFPMILRLQDDMGRLGSSEAQINLGSLVHGYLWALSERFQLGSSQVTNDILNEIGKRQRSCLWLQQIRLPAESLHYITQHHGRAAVKGSMGNPALMTPFREVPEFVSRIEEAYNDSVLSSAQSPPGSPGRNLAAPVLPHVSATGAGAPPRGNLLPLVAKEQMLSTWSREACLAAADREKTEAMSITGSRAGTLAARHHAHLNGNEGSTSSNHSPASAHPGAAGLQSFRRMSATDSRSTFHSSRDSPVHVTELRRALTINKDDQNRRLSPLRGRLASTGSVRSSSSESMVSGYSLSQLDGDGGSVRPQITRDGWEMDGDGVETPRASKMPVTDTDGRQSQRLPNGAQIPPVPPLPPSLSIPGCFPNDSERSLNSDRPSTAPGPNMFLANGTAGAPDAQYNHTLDRHKSRSSSGLNGTANGASTTIDGAEFSIVTSLHRSGEDADMEQRREVQKLLDGFLSPMNSDARPSTARVRRGYNGRRSVSGGIGRPPY
ncbi:hypothetical protein P168DRAFT_314539 [Aspergillus campestris IBT 28561]|uniref:Protein efr3 n=1 Tax=Aspergillus campestris (strain IBT 28561) TaxID=1392248 RepID=A0A2I1DEY8_ASPC2|nr:uncharacterized protein P168DRAFT_314539 [Aspergillus campestris IBT 28561]PKY08445.1 hypothetical protein P168DRAFT_314539 [Aspergillus campestris IBT 28561]